ncbi:MAG: hypothetical protein ACI4IM_01335, partial [Acutalibacteraceae bacterium]
HILKLLLFLFGSHHFNTYKNEFFLPEIYGSGLFKKTWKNDCRLLIKIANTEHPKIRLFIKEKTVFS